MMLCPICTIGMLRLDFYSASSLKQQSVGRHIAPLGYIILILSQLCSNFGVTANTNLTVFGLTIPKAKTHVLYITAEMILYHNNSHSLAWFIYIVQLQFRLTMT